MTEDLKGKVVIVTGAATGIGRATARAYAKRGARLVLASRSTPALEAVGEVGFLVRRADLLEGLVRKVWCQPGRGADRNLARHRALSARQP